MTPTALLLASLDEQGLSLRAAGGKLLVSPATRLTPELRDAITALRAPLLATLGEDERAQQARDEALAAYYVGPRSVRPGHGRARAGAAGAGPVAGTGAGDSRSDAAVEPRAKPMIHYDVRVIVQVRGEHSERYSKNGEEWQHFCPECVEDRG